MIIYSLIKLFFSLVFIFMSYFVLHTVLFIDKIDKCIGVEFSRECPKAPDECPNEFINFYLYTSENSSIPIQLFMNDEKTIKDAPLIKNTPIKFIIHGWKGYRDSKANRILRKAYFDKNLAINIINLDYGPLARKNCYPQAVSNSQAISKCTAQFVDMFLNIRKDFTMLHIHFIGFSMGCHVAGQMKEHLKSGPMERLTVLDAAFPLFYLPKKDGPRRLNKGDAKFIDALHTNGGILGVIEAVGNVDFYANNGIFQPGCGTTVGCSHNRTVELFAASLDPNNRFLAHRKSDKKEKVYFGEYVDYGVDGKFHFDTTDKFPFFKRVTD